MKPRVVSAVFFGLLAVLFGYLLFRNFDPGTARFLSHSRRSVTAFDHSLPLALLTLICLVTAVRSLAVTAQARTAVVAVWLFAGGSAMGVECKVQTFEAVEFTTCRVALRHESLQLYWRDEAGKPYARLSHLRDSLASQGKKLSFAMNAGIYEADLSPLGLFVVEGRELRPLNRRTGFGNFYQPPNGVFLVDDAGARVITTEEYANSRPHPRLATQSGPMLVLRGAITDSPVMDAQSTSMKVRNGVCAPSPDAAVFVISDGPLSFYVFAKFFIDEMGCREALYLDGSISSLYAPQVGREDDARDLGPMFGVAQ